MKPKKPKDGWPWDRAGYEFYTAAMRKWLGGYVPILAAEMCRKKGSGGNSRQSTETRNKAMFAGEAWATGTIPGLGAPADPGKSLRMLKNSKLG